MPTSDRRVIVTDAISGEGVRASIASAWEAAFPPSERHTAYVLVQAREPRPGVADSIAEAVATVSGVATAVPTIGAFDTVATVAGRTPENVAGVVRRIQRLKVVGTTLTLAAIPPTEATR